MSLKFSTGLRAGLLVTGPLRTLLAGGEIRLYSGPVPASVDNALGGSNILLCTIKTSAGAGLTFEATAPGGTVTKTLAELWQGEVVAAGSATFYRHVLASDTGVASTTAVRVQGNVAIAGADMVLSNTALTVGAIQKLEAYSITLPEF
ncbi:hypothetical protein N5C80_26575 [Pseudomonas nicosulfuronedens]|uniref:hypothetical protein n=1 Tax=Pseudomonas nicosulfuronedens TaxID=2571105 RepID=UPI0024470E4C|nr:hypothetical protein [Pseudomonas nicosulfuronedens]MDH1012313.1 hypothetical protein [Pseudomonas nicosulfuronedens]MDH2030482.1 hypothetical protein [Pseudomonas nicosulfuronedens]